MWSRTRVRALLNAAKKPDPYAGRSATLQMNQISSLRSSHHCLGKMTVVRTDLSLPRLDFPTTQAALALHLPRNLRMKKTVFPNHQVRPLTSQQPSKRQKSILLKHCSKNQASHRLKTLQSHHWRSRHCSPSLMLRMPMTLRTNRSTRQRLSVRKSFAREASVAPHPRLICSSQPI